MAVRFEFEQTIICSNVMFSRFRSNMKVDTEESADTMNERKEVSTKSVRVSDSEAGRLCTAAMAEDVG